MSVLAWICFGCAAVPALLYLWNSFLFREPPTVSARESSHRVISVLIPARNEERGIAACIEAVLASRMVVVEVIVLDDHSSDRTPEIVRELAARDTRVRVELAPALPDGWCGKQHACHALAKLARYDVFTFLDADVRLEPDALVRMLAFLERSGAGLVSGFPRQETGTFLEKLLIPLIHWLLLCFLPLFGMRHSRWTAFGAGCGQWFMTTRLAYETVGGHAVVKSSLHDGLQLPRAYRRAGLLTDVCDATSLATCRMYHSARGVWLGLAKNAREGLAGQIGFWTVVLLCGQVLPLLTLLPNSGIDQAVREMLGGALLIGVVTRLLLAIRFDRCWLGVLLHPLAILLLLAIQWYALLHALTGRPIGWKGRRHPITRPDPPGSPDPPSP